MKAALARSFEPVQADQPARLLGTHCSSCGEVIRPIKESGASTLIELSCNRCGSSDVYHVNSLRPLSLLIEISKTR